MPVTINDIQRAICAEFSITSDELLGTCRVARIAHPRAIAVQLCRKFTKASFPMLGRAFRRHHSTCVVLARRAHDLIDFNPALFDKRQAVLRRLGLE